MGKADQAWSDQVMVCYHLQKIKSEFNQLAKVCNDWRLLMVKVLPSLVKVSVLLCSVQNNFYGVMVQNNKLIVLPIQRL